MTYLTKSLIALIIAGAALVVGAKTSLAQDTESTETVVVDSVDPLVCGDQGVLQLLSSPGHNGTAHVKRFNLDTGNYDNIGWSIKQHADHNSMGYSFRDFNGAAINPVDSKVYGTIKGQDQQLNRYLVRFDMDGDFEILARIGTWVAAGAFDLDGTWYGPAESGTGGVVIPDAASLVGYSTMDAFRAAESAPFYEANGFSFSKPRGDKSAHDIVIVEEESQKLMIGISDTGVIQIKNLITGVETQFTGPVDEGLIPGGDYGAAYNFQNEVYASNNNGNGMIWIDWRNADYENNTIRTVNVFSKTQSTNRNDGLNCIQEKSPLDIPEDINTEPLCDLYDEVDLIPASDSDCVPCPSDPDAGIGILHIHCSVPFDFSMEWDFSCDVESARYIKIINITPAYVVASVDMFEAASITEVGNPVTVAGGTSVRLVEGIDFPEITAEDEEVFPYLNIFQPVVGEDSLASLEIHMINSSNPVVHSSGSPFYVDCVEAVPCEFDDSLLATDNACVEPVVEEPVAMCEIGGLEDLTVDDENCDEVEEVANVDNGDSEEDNSTEKEVEEIAVTDKAPETEEEVEEIAITDEAPETEEKLPRTGGMHLYMVVIALALLVAGSLLLASSKIRAAHKVIA